MSTTPAVSVIIAFLNAESYLREAIESVFAQTYNNWELLLVDDGSTDGSTAIARAYAELNSGKISYLEHEGHLNRGISASRNLGISQARGEFLAFLDADDVWLSGKLQKQVKCMNANPDVALLFNPAFVWKDGTRTPQRMPLLPGRLERGEWLVTLLARERTDAFPSAVMMLKDVAVELGGFVGSNLYEDQTTWIKFSLNSTVYYDEEPVALYRVHPASSCASADPGRYLLEEIGFYQWIITYLRLHHSAGFDRRFPTVMARCNLVAALLRLMQRSNSKRADRFRRSFELVREDAEFLGVFLSILLLLGAISPKTGYLIAEGVFVFARRTYGEGLRSSVWVIPQYSVQLIRGMIPERFKPSIRKIMAIATGLKSQPR